MANTAGPVIQAIIWDFGGVFDPKHEALPGFTTAAARLGVAPELLYELMYSGEAWQQARLGRITDDEYLRAVMLAIDPSAPDVATFRDRLWSGQQIDLAVVDLARRMAAVYPMALLSNATDRLETTLAEHHLAGLFTVVINSARVGVAKPDPQIYRLALDGLGVSAHAALFIDDKPRNITAAEQLGIPSVLFSNATELELELVARGMTVPRGAER